MRADSSENLKELRSLVDRLDDNKIHSDEYNSLIGEIAKIIKSETKIIGQLKKSEIKIKHYEGICASILTLISTTEM